MIVYVESNFVLERALLRDEHESCERLLELARSGRLRLLLPAFSVGEPYEAWVRRARKRAELSQRLVDELDELARSQPYADSVEETRGLVTLLSISRSEEKQRLDDTLTAVLQVAELIPVDADVTRRAIRSQQEVGLSPQDSLVYASVLRHLSDARAGDKCFITKNTSDFYKPQIRAELARGGCRLLGRFGDGLGFVTSR